MSINKCFYKDRIALNVLANSVENAKNVYNAAEGRVLVGILTKDYFTVKETVNAIQTYSSGLNGRVSIGLGDGDNRQASVVANVAKHYSGIHFNQVFPYVGITRAYLTKKDSWINSLVSPSGKVGYVNISTGPISAEQTVKAIVPIKSAIALIRDMGGNSLKYFPMDGLTYEDEFREVARVCGEENFGLEPTGGINKSNIKRILQIVLEQNVPKVILHVYSSIINKETGETNIDDVRDIYIMIKDMVDKYE